MPEPTTAARAAAEWWAKQVGAPTHRIVEDDQRDFRSDFFELGMLGLAHDNPPPADVTPFVDALEKLYDELLDKRDDRVSLGVDYGPDMELGAVAKAHGIHPARFPLKTNLWAYPDHVVVSLGYRGAHTLIWQHPDWARPMCESLQFNERTQKFGQGWCTKPRYHDGEHGDWRPDPRRCTGCGLGEGGHIDRDGDYHRFEVAS